VPARPSFQNASTIISSDYDEDEADDATSEDDGEDSERAPARRKSGAVDIDEDENPAVPAPLLARLLHDGFEDGGVKIQKEAMAVVGKYVEIFVREAVARAAVEREGAGGLGVSDGFLQVRLSPMCCDRDLGTVKRDC
jgi:hypothetical protein